VADTLTCDVAVIGAGTAGLAAERAARHNGASTLLIDPTFNGTTCANVGCMPSKLLIAAATEAHRIARADLFGIRVGAVTIDGPAVMQRLRSERDRFAAGTRHAMERLDPATTLRASARFIGPDRLQLDDGRTVQARTIVIATGSSPLVPPPFAALGDRLLTSDSVWDLPDLPRRLAVVGSGSIGIELAQAFARLGVEVSLFDRGHSLIKLRCPKVHATLQAIIERDLTVHQGVAVLPERTTDGVHIRWNGDSSGEAEFDMVLAALGRPPNLDGLDLDKAGLGLDEHGVPCHDRRTMRCGDSAIFLAGDVAADLPLLHEASHDGAIAGRNAAAYPAPIRTPRHVPFSLTFTDPPVATIGDPEAEGAVTGTADYGDQGRARVEGRNEGTLTLYAAAPDGRLIGADLVAPGGEHLAHMLAWAIERRLTGSEMLELPFYHPTLEEGLKQALRTICAATPIELPVDQDSGTPSGA
jgi:dihydrolipoamide dehydrogenase